MRVVVRHSTKLTGDPLDFASTISHPCCSIYRLSVRQEPMKRLLVLILYVLLSSNLLHSQRPGDFKVVGPGGGGAMFHPTVSPHDPNTVLIACDMTGAYIT